MLLSPLGNLGEARQLRERALRIGERSLAPCDPAVTALITGVANSRKLDGEFAEARTLYRRCKRRFRNASLLTIPRLQPTPTRPQSTTRRPSRGTSAILWRRTELYQRAVQIWSRAVGLTHPFVARGLDSVAEVAASRGQLERARLLYERALGIRRLKVGEEHPDVAWTLTNLAQTSAESGHLTLAARYVTRALEIFSRAGPSDEPDHLARVLALRGDIEIRRGDYLSARASFAEALSTREQIFGASHPLVADSQARLAAADLARDRRTPRSRARSTQNEPGETTCNSRCATSLNDRQWHTPRSGRGRWTWRSRSSLRSLPPHRHRFQCRNPVARGDSR